jgi:hypothetical protein
VQILDTERGGATNATSNGYSLPVDEISVLWGKPWREIALDAFSNHRSQGITGFVNSPFLRRPLVLVREDGSKLDPTSLASPLHDLPSGSVPEASFRHAMSEAESAIAKARTASLSLNWSQAAADLASAATQIDAISPAGNDAPPSPLSFELARAHARLDRAWLWWQPSRFARKQTATLSSSANRSPCPPRPFAAKKQVASSAR